MRYQPKKVSYPQSSEELHVVTPTGKSVYITNNLELAKQHKGLAFGFKVIRVTTIKEEVDLKARKPKLAAVA